MSIKFQCQCGRWLRVPDESAGQRARCPACQCVFVVPTPQPVVVDPEPISSMGYQQDEPEETFGTSADDQQPTEDNHFDIVDDTDQAAARAAEKAAAERRRLLAIKAQHYGLTPKKTKPVMKLPPGATGRPYRYLVLLLALIPLAWSTFRPGPTETVQARIAQTVQAHPEIQQQLDSLPDDATEEQVFDALPNHKLDGALLPHDTFVHWGFALASGAGFFGLVLLLFPPGHAKVWQLLVVGLFTGTAGIVLLLGFQWIAFHMPLFRGTGMITLLLDIVWLIGQSYSMALGDHGFVVSALGFTAGVGFCEEACKALPLIWVARTRGFYTWRSAMIWGLISGVGFGVSEGITYSHDYYNGISGAQLYLVRFISCVALHGIWAAATGINIFRRQDFFRSQMHPLEWIFQVLITVIVPMCLHGMYDTLLKQQYDWAALLVALASFGWLAWQIELAKRKLDRLAINAE